jgi:hypothetical protein
LKDNKSYLLSMPEHQNMFNNTIVKHTLFMTFKSFIFYPFF